MLNEPGCGAEPHISQDGWPYLFYELNEIDKMLPDSVYIDPDYNSPVQLLSHHNLIRR